MRCANCGSPLSSNAKFCPECGQPTGVTQRLSDAAEPTRVLKRKHGAASDVAKTTALPRPAARHTQATTTTSQDRDWSPQPQSPRRRSLLPVALLAVATVIVILVASLAIRTLSKGGTSGESDKPTAVEQSTEAADGSASEQESTNTTTQTPDEDQQADDTSEDPASGDGYEAWSNAAQSFMTIYPVNHIRTGGEGDEPVYMDIDTWASNCLLFVDPESSLGQALLNDPESVAVPLGYYDVAAYVSGTNMTSVDENGVVTDVTMQGTQVSWDFATEFSRTYLVQFNDSGQIANVVDMTIHE